MTTRLAALVVAILLALAGAACGEDRNGDDSRGDDNEAPGFAGDQGEDDAPDSPDAGDSDDEGQGVDASDE